MPISKEDAYERHPAISLRAWKNKETKRIEFLDDGKDMKVEYGDAFLHLVREEGSTAIKELWIRKGGSLHIGLAPHAPLKGKTLEITHTIGKENKDTRYTAKVI